MAEAQPNTRPGSRVSKALEDRIQPDGEMVGQVLEPNRSRETVQFPDPSSPQHAPADYQSAPDSVADVQMSRRTDAGAYEPLADDRSNRWNGLPWLIGAAVLLIVVVALVAAA